MIADQKCNKKIVGFYLLDGDSDGAKLATSSKPNWFRKFCMWMFLGWKFNEA